MKSGLIVPCGKCPACLANQRQEWVFRLKQEYLDSKFSIFVTLTYDNEHLPDNMSVNKTDVQLFHKRLRKYFPPGDLRYYVVSEYGDHTQRPHYHGLYFFKSVYDTSFVYDVFEKSWQNGFIKFGQVEEGSIVYCTKYCLKHSATPPGRTETFRLLSKMQGGLGSHYLKKMSEYHIDSEQFNFVSQDGKTCRMPRYYRDKLQFLFKHLREEEYATRIENAIEKQKQEHIQRFKNFLKTHPGLDYETAIKQFEIADRKSHDVRDELILKHTKKQKM